MHMTTLKGHAAGFFFLNWSFSFSDELYRVSHLLARLIDIFLEHPVVIFDFISFLASYLSNSVTSSFTLFFALFLLKKPLRICKNLLQGACRVLQNRCNIVFIPTFPSQPCSRLCLLSFQLIF